MWETPLGSINIYRSDKVGAHTEARFNVNLWTEAAAGGHPMEEGESRIEKHIFQGDLVKAIMMPRSSTYPSGKGKDSLRL